MSIEELIKDAAKQYNQAMALNDLDTAEHYHKQVQYLQDELDKQINQRIDNQNFLINPPMYKITSSIDPATISGAGAGSIISWTTNKSDLVFNEDAEFKAQKELDQRRNLKLFIHFSKLFCERYPNWTLTPDSNNPFKGVELSHKNNKYKIESAYPDNAIKVIGIDTNQAREDLNFRRRRGIPNAIFRPAHEVVPTYTFFGWAIGMDDTPEWVKE